MRRPASSIRRRCSVAYGAGLRVAEVSSLKVSDIDSERMLLRVERGKGGQYRNAMLSADMLALLRQWWKVGRRQGGTHPKAGCFQASMPASRSAPDSCIGSSSRRRGRRTSPSGLDPHTLRHSFATHLLEDGVDIRVIQALLGHAKLENTAFYTKVATRTARAVTSPLDKLGIVTPDQAAPGG